MIDSMEAGHPDEPYFSENDKIWNASFLRNYRRISATAKIRVLVLQSQIKAFERGGAPVLNMDAINSRMADIWRIFNIDEPPEKSFLDQDDGSGI